MKKGITFGAFDLFHAGHVLMLKEAKTVCDYLIVALQTDPSLDRDTKNVPVQSIEEREINFKVSLTYVGQSFVRHTTTKGYCYMAKLLIKVKGFQNN